MKRTILAVIGIIIALLALFFTYAAKGDGTGRNGISIKVYKPIDYKYKQKKLAHHAHDL
jgi:hypothetical protein